MIITGVAVACNDWLARHYPAERGDGIHYPVPRLPATQRNGRWRNPFTRALPSPMIILRLPVLLYRGPSFQEGGANGLRTSCLATRACHPRPKVGWQALPIPQSSMIARSARRVRGWHLRLRWSSLFALRFLMRVPHLLHLIPLPPRTVREAAQRPSYGSPTTFFRLCYGLRFCSPFSG
jgi:hypothetical protein